MTPHQPDPNSNDPAAPSRRARAARLSVIAAVTLTLVWAFVGRVAVPNGLQLTLYEGERFTGEPLLQDTTTQIDLSFIDQSEELPRRFFGARWQGYWFLPRSQEVDLYAGADDEVSVFIDGELVVRRNPAVGMSTISSPLTLSAGAHRIRVEYRQLGGGYHLRVESAPSGAESKPLHPGRLFNRQVGAFDFWLATSATWLRRLTIVTWAGLLLLWLVLPWMRAGLIAWWRELASMTIRDPGKRFASIAPVALLAPAMVFFVGPHTIHTNNSGEFALGFFALAFPWLVGVVLIVWAVLVTIGCILPKNVARGYVAVLFALGLLLWAQGNLWVGDYGVLDGTGIDFSRLESRVPYELGVWGLVLTAALLFRRQFSALAPSASAVFLAVQGVAIVFSSLGPAAEGATRWQEPAPELFEFSVEHNVIHVVLDEFQSDVLKEIVDAERALIDESFSGFTFFDDNAGTFPTTALSMPAMLTGNIYRGEQPVREFVREAFDQGSIFSGLRAHGYEIDIVSILSGLWLSDWVGVDERAEALGGAFFPIRKPFVSAYDYRKFSARLLIELSVFRYSPHVVKTRLAANPDWFNRMFWAESSGSVAVERRQEASNSAAFFEQFIDQMTVARATPVYKLIHLGVPHRPVVMDRQCAFIGVVLFKRDPYLGQSGCAVDLVSEFLDRLRSFGIYDSSLIIVSSDHGTSLVPRGFTGQSDSLPLRRGPSTASLGHIAGTAKAIMMIKPPGAAGPLVVSQAPTMQSDLPATVFDVLGLDHRFPGQSMLRRDPDEQRQRTFSSYDVSQRFPEGYLERLDLLTVDGSLLDASLWSFSRSIMPPDADYSFADIDPGEREAMRFLGPGWEFPRRELENEAEEGDTFVLGQGRQAVVFVTLPDDSTELRARVESAEESAWDEIEVRLDGRVLGRWVPAGDGYRDYTLPIPADPSRPGVSTMTFHFVSSAAEATGVRFDRILIAR